ncbi:MAG: family acetyltransferase [Nocardioides sp.]|nr:family acetyltransferase [Nocardioides sp.]
MRPGILDPVRIEPDDLTSAEVVAFLEAHVAQLRSLSPPESSHALDLAGLRAPGVSFWTAYDGGELVGCVALKRLDAGHAELKSMRTAPHRVGAGIGSRLVEHVLDHARAAGCARINLETGSEEFFAPARRLYARHGFVECPPFGDYRPDPLSTFMTREV